MNAGRDVERLIAGWLREESPGRAPDRILVDAAEVIDRTKQRRFTAAWREPMVLSAWRLAAAVIVVIAIGIGFGWFGRSWTVAGPATNSSIPTTSPSVTPLSTPIPRPIPNGTYYSAEIPVADIMTRLEADTELTGEQRTGVINDVLTIADATTLRVKITIDDDVFNLAYGTDGTMGVVEAPWRLYVLDPTTIAMLSSAESSGIQAWGVTRDGDGFTLHALSPAAEPVEAFVRSVLFETTPFSPIP